MSESSCHIDSIVVGTRVRLFTAQRNNNSVAIGIGRSSFLCMNRDEAKEWPRHLSLGTFPRVVLAE